VGKGHGMEIRKYELKPVQMCPHNREPNIREEEESKYKSKRSKDEREATSTHRAFNGQTRIP